MLQPNFSFNSSTHDLWDIYESIKKYYPIGLKKYEGKGIYYDYPGIKKLEKIVVENVHDGEKFHERWVGFTTEIGKELGKKIVGTTYGQAPSFSSSIILKRIDFENCIHRKELCFSVSLVGNFFQIYGLDSTLILDKEEWVEHSNIGMIRKSHSARSVVTISPFEEYKEAFEFVEEKLRSKYPEHRMIPFFYGQQRIQGLQVRYLDDENCSVNQALFNDFLNEQNISRSTRGNKFYGSDEDWAIK